MKNFFVILTAFLICTVSSTAFAETPTCIMLQFSNDTRYKNVDTASVLSELVFEKLLAKGKFDFKETKPIDKDMELMLYDEKMRDINNLQKSIEHGNFNALFEDGSFDSNHAQSIATAKVGQIVSPSITAAISKEHDADYLIQRLVWTFLRVYHLILFVDFICRSRRRRVVFCSIVYLLCRAFYLLLRAELFVLSPMYQLG